MSDKTCYLLLFGLISISASSNLNCSVAVPTINCICDDTMKKINCTGTEADNSTIISNINNILMSSAVSNISEVHIESPKLKIHAGIMFPNVTIQCLSIINSDLTELPELALSNLNGLLKLTLTGNSFINIPSKSLTHLSTLSSLKLSHNKIKQIYVGDLSNLTSLTYLLLIHNVVSSIEDDSFSSLINLKELNMGNNALSSLKKDMFKGLKNLITLDISANNLLQLSKDLFTHLTNLQNLFANDNNFALLKNIEVVSPSLEKLFLKNSSINGPLEHGILKGLLNLTTLFLSNNPIRTVSSFAFAHLQKLMILKLDSCRLATLNETAFHNLTRLETLDLSNNTLHEFTCMHTLYLESLKEINLEENQLKTIGKGTFNYSNSLGKIDLEGNKLLCNCQLAGFANLLKARSLDLDEFECNNDLTMAEVNFTGMNCVDNVDICKKVKEVTNLPNVNPTIFTPLFTIKFGQIIQQGDTLDVNYFINKSGNFPIKNFTCEIANTYMNIDNFQSIPLDCELDNKGVQFINIGVAGEREKGEYNVCISIFYHDKTYFVECTTTEYNPPDLTSEQTQYSLSSTSSTINNNFETTTYIVTALLTTTEDVSSHNVSILRTSTTAGSASKISKVETSTMTPTTYSQTTDSSMIKNASLSFTYLPSTLTETSPRTTTLPLTTHLYTTASPTTHDQTTETSVIKNASLFPTYLPSTLLDTSPKTTTLSPTTKQYTTASLSDNQTIDSSMIENASLSFTYFPSTITEAPTRTITVPFTTQEYATSPTVTSTTNITKYSYKIPSMKLFSIYKDAKSQLWVSWNMTSEHPKNICILKFYILLQNQHQGEWQMECKNGSYCLGDLKSTHPYEICVEMYFHQKPVEINCTEVSPTFPTSAASSKDSGQSAKLPVITFIILIILAFIIVLLIIIVLIKLIYLRRNKTNIYNVAKEEDNQNSKRSSNLYSVSSVEDDQV